METDNRNKQQEKNASNKVRMKNDGDPCHYGMQQNSYRYHKNNRPSYSFCLGGQFSVPQSRLGEFSSACILCGLRCFVFLCDICGIPALRALFLFLSFPIRDPALNPSYEFSNHVHHQARQHKYACKPATTDRSLFSTRNLT